MVLKIQRFRQYDVRLANGVTLPEVETAYLTCGVLDPDGRNAVLVTHGYTGGPDMVDPDSELIDGSWKTIVGPGMPIDTNRFFVICPNALGSSFGSTNASSIDPRTDRPYGSSFPDITVGDIVAGQRALLQHLSVNHLVMAIGPSFGGAQVLQWGVDYPDLVDGLVAVMTAPKMPGVNVAALEQELAVTPGWLDGDYYERTDLTEVLTARRIKTLAAFGANEVLAERYPDPEARAAEIMRIASRWAKRFDANSLLILFRAMARYDVSAQLHRIVVPVLYVLSRTDKLVPPSLAPLVMAQFEAAGVKARYIEIDSEHGHSASGTDAHSWTPALCEFIDEISPLDELSSNPT